MANANRRRWRPWIRGAVITIFVVFVAVTIGILYLRAKINQVPDWWAPADAGSVEVVALGESVENAIVTEVNRARPGSTAAPTSDWTLHLTEDDRSLLRRMAGDRVTITARELPDTPRTNLTTLLGD